MELRVHQQHIVARRGQQRAGIPEFERQMRLAAAEVDAAVERPRRIDESELHEATRSPTTSLPAAVPTSSSHAASLPTPSLTVVRGRHPVAAVNFDVSDT